MIVEVGQFNLLNEEKYNRAIKGVQAQDGSGNYRGGVGENASQVALLAEYDRLGGLITKNGLKVKTGSFYDFKKRQPRELPDVSKFEVNVDGDLVDLTEDEAASVKSAQEKIKKMKADKEKKNKQRPDKIVFEGSAVGTKGTADESVGDDTTVTKKVKK